jgi:hypothetical protein
MCVLYLSSHLMCECESKYVLKDTSLNKLSCSISIYIEYWVQCILGQANQNSEEEHEYQI